MGEYRAVLNIHSSISYDCVLKGKAMLNKKRQNQASLHNSSLLYKAIIVGRNSALRTLTFLESSARGSTLDTSCFEVYTYIVEGAWGNPFLPAPPRFSRLLHNDLASACCKVAINSLDPIPS